MSLSPKTLLVVEISKFSTMTFENFLLQCPCCINQVKEARIFFSKLQVIIFFAEERREGILFSSPTNQMWIRKVLCGFLDTLMWMPALTATAFVALQGTECLNPSLEDMKRDKIPIFLLHGNGFNESQFLVARRHFAADDRCGSVFSFNLDGWLTNRKSQGIEAYALKLRDKVREIMRFFEHGKLCLVGHSMGGLVAAYFAEHLIDPDLQVTKIITICTPWSPPPLLLSLTSLTQCWAPKLFLLPARWRQMRDEGGFVSALKQRCRGGPRARCYVAITSEDDVMVPAACASLDLSPEQEFRFTFLGHYTCMLSPDLWGLVVRLVSSPHHR